MFKMEITFVKHTRLLGPRLKAKRGIKPNRGVSSSKSQAGNMASMYKHFLLGLKIFSFSFCFLIFLVLTKEVWNKYQSEMTTTAIR